MTSEKRTSLGTIRLEGNAVNTTLKLDAFAYDSRSMDNPVMILSAVGPQSSVQAFSAGLQLKTKVSFRLKNVPGVTSWKKFSRHKDGYKIYKHRLGHATWQMLAIAKSSNLLPSCSESSVWQLLRSDAFTTPILNDWRSEIYEKMVEKKYLRRLTCFDCSAAVVEFTSDQLDAIVSNGIESGELTFPKTESAAVAH